MFAILPRQVEPQNRAQFTSDTVGGPRLSPWFKYRRKSIYLKQ